MTKTARFLVYAVFVYTCVEGLVINILYPSKLPYIYKDLLILLLYLSVLAPDLNRVFNPSPTAAGLNWALAAFALVIGLYLLVPTRVTLLSELVAVKQRLYYIPLIYVAYLFLATTDDFRRLVTVAGVSAIFVSLFGIYLYFTGPEGLVRLGATYSAIIYTPGGGPASYWRVPGTFTSPGQYGGYLAFNLLVVTGVLASPGVSRRARAVLGTAVVLMVLAVLTSGSRAALVVASGSVALAFIMSGRLGRTAVWALALYAILAYGFVVLGPGVRERFGSIASYEHVERFQRTYFGQLFWPTLVQNPGGLGLGTATIGARHFSEFREVMLVESYLGILAVETGVLGLAAFLLVVWQLLRLVVRFRALMARSPDATLWLTSAAYVVQTCAVLSVSTALDAAPSNLYFWFTVGVIIRMVDIEQWRLWLATRPETVEAAAEVTADAAVRSS
jgi:hypothetical protein